jgi:vacuolar protein sorting-associated protein 72
MATDDVQPTRDESSDSGSASDGDSDSGEVQQVEWLATTRAKRSTAGNRMKSMLANEEPAADDDDLELLFADDGDDAGFTDAEKDDSDVHMDSSSDDEDADENAEEDAGEKELERQAREKRNAARKRKAQAAIPVKFRKKVRIEQPPTTASASPAPQQAAPKPPRPKKKSERASWLPTAAEMPTRASERQTTRLSKEQLHQQMLEREVKRKKIMEAMERKAKKMEALKKPPLTQAQRLAEAAAVEKRNAKSLNRWEEAEKQREEERLRKIAALQNRKLDGPVVTFWSGIQELDGDQMKNLGKMVAIEEKAPRKKRQSLAAIQEAGAAKGNMESNPVTPVEGPTLTTQESGGQKGAQSSIAAPLQAPAPSSTETPLTAAPLAPPPHAPPAPLPQPSMAPPAPDGPRFAPLPSVGPPTQQAAVMHPPSSSPMQPPAQQSQLQAPRGSMAPPPIPPPPTGGGFLAAPSMLGHPFGVPPQIGSQMPMMGIQARNTQSNVLAAPGAQRSSLSAPSPLSMPQPQPQPQNSSQSIPGPQGINMASGASITQPNGDPTATLQTQPAQTPLQPIQGNATPRSPATPGDRTPAPSETGKVTRSCIILQNFDEHAIKDKQVQTQILFGRKMNKLASKFLVPLPLFFFPPFHII